MTSPTDTITTAANGSWNGTVALLGVRADGGQVLDPPRRGELLHRELPTSLLWQDDSNPDNPTVHVVGSVTALTITDGQVTAAGDLDMLNPDGQRLYALAAGAPVPVALMLEDVLTDRTVDTDGAVTLTYSRWKIAGVLITRTSSWPEATLTLSDQPAPSHD